MSRNSWRFVGGGGEEEDEAKARRKECESWRESMGRKFLGESGILRKGRGRVIITKTRRWNGNRMILIVRLRI